MRAIKILHQQEREFVRVLKALASPVRLNILAELSRGDRCLCELQVFFALDKSTLSRHLTILKKVNLIAERRQGVRHVLRLQTCAVFKLLHCVAEVTRETSVKPILKSRTKESTKHG